MKDELNLEYRYFPHAADTRIAVQQLIQAADDTVPHLMFCGGFHSSMSGNKATEIHKLCQRKSWNYTRFDYRGHGASDGSLDKLTLHDWLDDTLAVLDACQGPTLVIGSSMGAWLACLAALRRPESVSALLLLAAAPDFLQELIEPSLGATEQWDLQQGKTIELPNNYAEPHPVTQELLESGKSLSLLNSDDIGTLHCPVRLLHGTGDHDVPYTLSVRLMEKLANPKATLTLLNHVDHRVSDAHSIDQIVKLISELVDQCSSQAI
ncbi:MAG: alpha/beta hydrolase [Granulosicoccus sp.]|nr:alpha/beta hydrolase [Granulosicoccus sp.]